MPSRPSSRDALGIADRADRGRQLAGHDEHVHAGGLQPRARPRRSRPRVASGVITIIMGSRPSSRTPELVGAEVVRQLVAHGARDLVAQLVRVVAEVAQQRVAEDDDPVGVVVARDACRPGRARRRGGGGPCRRSRPATWSSALRSRSGRSSSASRTSSSKSSGRSGSSSRNSVLVGLGGEVLAREPLRARARAARTPPRRRARGSRRAASSTSAIDHRRASAERRRPRRRAP